MHFYRRNDNICSNKKKGKSDVPIIITITNISLEKNIFDEDDNFCTGEIS